MKIACGRELVRVLNGQAQDSQRCIRRMRAGMLYAVDSGVRSLSIIFSAQLRYSAMSMQWAVDEYGPARWRAQDKLSVYGDCWIRRGLLDCR